MPGKVKDIAGDKYGRLTVAAFVRIDKTCGALWHCLCDCGNTMLSATRDLRSGNTKSCGCWKKDTLSKIRTHGAASNGKQTGAYRSYQSMLQRCNYPGAIEYHLYGGRGITVCERWTGPGGFENFLSDLGERPDWYSIERADVNAGYSPENCSWIPRHEQAKNTRNTVWFLAGGQRMCQADAARFAGMTSQQLSSLRKTGRPLPSMLIAMTT